jgi:magnesium-transporting ATPase (P-type)
MKYVNFRKLMYLSLHFFPLLSSSLLIMCILACAAIFARLMTYPAQSDSVEQGAGSFALQCLSIVVVILVASIPVAIEVVVTSTMAVGSHVMASKKVIVARLSAIEELAGMTVLCSDKTGTLTLNKLSLREPVLLAAKDKDELTMYAALASKREGDLDAIDFCINNALTPEAKAVIASYTELDHVPFDPVSKRTLSTIKKADGSLLKVSKGAPQVCFLNMYLEIIFYILVLFLFFVLISVYRLFFVCVQTRVLLKRKLQQL